MVFLESSNYLPEAVALASSELFRRGIPKLTPEEYWRQYPREWMESKGFCYPCWTQTTDDTPEPLFTIHFVGLGLRGSENPCPVCGSTVQTKWLVALVPLVPFDRFRVVQREGGKFIARRLKDQS